MLFLTLSRITWERKAKSGNKYALINSYCFVQFFWVRTTLKPLPTHTHNYNTLVKPRWTLQYSNSILTSENFRLHHVFPGIGISQHELKPNSTVLFLHTRCSGVPVFLVLVHAKYHGFGTYWNTRAYQNYHRYILHYLVVGKLNDLEHENLRMFSWEVVRLGL